MTGAVATILTTVILAGATARLTRLITEDTITAPLRTWVMRKAGGPDTMAYTWIKCPWCVGLWIAFAVTLTAWSASLLLDDPLLPVPAWLWVPGLALTNNYLAARLQA